MVLAWIRVQDRERPRGEDTPLAAPRGRRGGEGVVIARAGNPIARLVPAAARTQPRTPGAWRGQIVIADDFDETPEDLIDRMLIAQAARRRFVLVAADRRFTDYEVRTCSSQVRGSLRRTT
jgi:antitoxin (DNA-binding transcriptional repressor) of toxin-antitoxin stability system